MDCKGIIFLPLSIIENLRNKIIETLCINQKSQDEAKKRQPTKSRERDIRLRGQNKKACNTIIRIF